MNEQKKLRYVILIVTSFGLGILFTWIYALRIEDNPNQFLASLTIIALILIAHFLSSKLLGESVLFVKSYLEGITLYTLAMITLLVGARLFGLSSMSITTELGMILFSMICGTAYARTLLLVAKSKKRYE